MFVTIFLEKLNTQVVAHVLQQVLLDEDNGICSGGRIYFVESRISTLSISFQEEKPLMVRRKSYQNRL